MPKGYYPYFNTEVTHPEFTYWSMRVCGHTSVQNFTWGNWGAKLPKDWEAFFDEMLSKDSYAKSSWNISFAITQNNKGHGVISTAVAAPYGPDIPCGVLTYMLNQPGCKAIHSYENNAHPPGNQVVMFMWHKHVAQNKLNDKHWGLSAKEWLERYKNDELYEKVK